MNLSPNIQKRGCLYKITAAFFAAMLVLCSLVAEPMKATAEAVTTFTVTTTADSGAGSMRQAILDANALPSGSDFKIVIGVEGTLATLSALPELKVSGRSGWIQSSPNATITGFSSEIEGGGHLTLQNAAIDNSAYDLMAVFVPDNNSENTLFLSGSNRIIGNVAGYASNIGLDGTLTINKASGGSDMDSTLTLTDTNVGIRGSGLLQVTGGIIESPGVFDGIDAYLGVVVEGGKLIVTGGFFWDLFTCRSSFGCYDKWPHCRGARRLVRHCWLP